MKTILEIQKEMVKNLRFPNKEVLQSKKERIHRNISLKRASILGNIERTKTKIIFKDKDGIKKVNTTVWAFTEKYVILKGSNLIPLNRILDVY